MPGSMKSLYVTLSGKSSLILRENKAGFRRESHISMGIAERVDKVPYLENQDNFVTSSIDWEVASDSFSPIYQIAVFGWLHMVQ